MIRKIGYSILYFTLLASAGIQTLLAEEQMNPQVNWMLNCQGCHKPDASGIKGQIPSMKGFVARFLSVQGGRNYLIQVPGVAFSPLSDKQMAGLLNWMLATFDPEHIPENFKNFDQNEVKLYRKSPLVTEAAVQRQNLIGRMDTE